MTKQPQYIIVNGTQSSTSQQIAKFLNITGNDFVHNKLLTTHEIAQLAEKYRVDYVDINFELHHFDSSAAILTPKTTVLTFMGHVDHGKTSLLSAISHMDLNKPEYGGITQDLSAYNITYQNRSLTCIDTPGHQSFSLMRSLVTRVTDIIILVIAIDSGIMAQTVEAINYIKQFNKNCVIAITKVDTYPQDISTKQINSIQQDLARYGLITEAQGGDIPIVQVAYTNQTQVKDLMDAIILQADIHEYKCDLNAVPQGIILNSKQTKAGLALQIILSHGTLSVKDVIYSAGCQGYIKKIIDYNQRIVSTAEPAKPYTILGLNSIMPNCYNIYSTGQYLVKEFKKPQQQIATVAQQQSNQDFAYLIKQNQNDQLNIVLKSIDYQSLQALENAITTISLPAEYKVEFNIIQKSLGYISQHENDIINESKAIVISFKVNQTSEQDIQIISDNNIYQLITRFSDYIDTKYKPAIDNNKAKVVEVFKLQNLAKYIAGCYVETGVFKVNDKVTITRKGKVILQQALIISIHLKKQELQAATSGQHYGLFIKDYYPEKGDLISS